MRKAILRRDLMIEELRAGIPADYGFKEAEK